MLQDMDPSDPRYWPVSNACSELESVLSGNPSQNDIINAMSTLTLAMAGMG